MWDFFTEVFNPGGVGMGPYRTEFREIEAYARMTRQSITPTEAYLIRDLAELYIMIDAKKSGTPGLKNETPMSDSEGLRRLFSNAGRDRPAKTPGAKPLKVV